MRLWHQSLISHLPRQQLLGQHREVCALRGNGWNKKHSTVNYVFSHSPYMLYEYHLLVMKEMRKRGYILDKMWYNPLYRGKVSNPYTYDNISYEKHDNLIYKEHDKSYLVECLENLSRKGIIIKGVI